jgi:putative transposase
VRKSWFSVAELAAESLPELRSSKRGVAMIAERQRWDASDRARKREGRGGGLEYHYTLLPDAAQAALVARYAAVAANDGAPKVHRRTKAADAPRGAAAWAWYETLGSVMKDRAVARLEAVTRIETLRRRAGRGAAIRAVAEEQDVSVATVHNWLERVRGVPRADWLPALVPAPRGGGGRKVEIAEPVWDAFRTDYLRLSEPSFTSCYYRVKRLAAEHGWEMPNMRTLRRRADDIPEAVRVMARKGRDASKAIYPAQERDRSIFHALEAVNADGHKWDVFVQWEDGSIGRPLMVAFQDLYSNMFLAWRVGKTESKDAVRLCFGDLIETYGIPYHCWLDNGRAFASKWLTGGMPNRFRFKVKPEDPVGIFKQLGVEVHWTTPYAGQSKPIERGFGEFARDIAKHPEFDGAYTGNSPMAKPEDYGSKAVPIAKFIAIIDREIAAHNARAGRQTRVCAGKLSFQQAFDASYAASPIRVASAEQRRLCMLAAEGVRVRRQDGAIYLLGNRYWSEQLLDHRSRLVTVRFDPEQVHADLAVYAQDGTLICVAQLQEAAGFADTNAAREHAAARNAYLRATRERLDAERKMSLRDLVALQPKIAEHAPPETKIIRPMFAGNLALKPAPEAEAEDDSFDVDFAKGLRLVQARREEFST